MQKSILPQKPVEITDWSITGNGFQRSLLVSLLGVLIGIYKKYNQKLFLTTITRAGD